MCIFVVELTQLTSRLSQLWYIVIAQKGGVQTSHWWCYAYCLRPIYSVQIFIFSQFAPIEITAWGWVMWAAISWALLLLVQTGAGPLGPPNIPSSIGLGQGWEELKRVRKRNKSNINACPALNSSFLNILMGGFSTIQTDLSQNNLQINYQHHPFDKIFKMPSCCQTVLRKPTVFGCCSHSFKTFFSCLALFWAFLFKMFRPCFPVKCVFVSSNAVFNRIIEMFRNMRAPALWLCHYPHLLAT